VSEDLRLVDPEALDRKRTPRGRVSIIVPQRWLREGARLEVDLPARLKCDACDGGGCDACERSGAFKLPEDRRPVAVTLPRVTDDFLAVRVQHPFGDREPSLLVVRVAAGDEPSPGVRWLGENHDVEPVVPADPTRSGAPGLPQVPPWVQWVVTLAVAALAGMLAGRCGHG
jgi:hypothetical protein